jgi:hypothetical protein
MFVVNDVRVKNIRREFPKREREVIREAVALNPEKVDELQTPCSRIPLFFDARASNSPMSQKLSQPKRMKQTWFYTWTSDAAGVSAGPAIAQNHAAGRECGALARIDKISGGAGRRLFRSNVDSMQPVIHTT